LPLELLTIPGAINIVVTTFYAKAIGFEARIRAPKAIAILVDWLQLGKFKRCENHNVHRVSRCSFRVW